jgi:hypothetical protein
LSNVCPASDGTWRATITVTGDQLSGTWRDSYHGSHQYRIEAPLNGSRATWQVDSGSERITLKATFDFSAGSVRGDMTGPVCTSFAGRWQGTFRGSTR